MESAASYCKLRGNSHIEIGHWLHQAVQAADGDLHRIFRHYGIELSQIEKELLHGLAQLPSGAVSISNFSSSIELAIERAWVIASLGYGDYKIRSGYMLIALLQTAELRKEILPLCPSLRVIPVDALDEILPALISESPESQDATYDGSGMAQAMPGEASYATSSANDTKSGLQKYCDDLTEKAREGKIDPVIGREQEIAMMIDILLRRRQNNPLLVGEAGVGKTAVVEGLALAIAAGTIPPSLANVKLLSLDVGALLAGASMKGEFEARLKAVLEQAGQSPQPVILFVDEVHTLVGAGGSAGTGDAANLLKPALARGALRSIGATTWSEYKRHIEKDAALVRRFQVLQVSEPVEKSAVDMVRGLSANFEQHHKVLILDDAIRAAVTLSSRYIPSRQLPDKAISLLDTACARVALSLYAPPSELQRLYQEKKSAQLYLDICHKQANFEKISQQELTLAEQNLQRIDEQVQAYEKRWSIEKDLVHQLIQKRKECTDSDQSRANKTESTASLRHLETQVKSLQSGERLVHSEVSEETVAQIVSEWTGIPVGRMIADDLRSVLNLSKKLQSRVIGQNDGIERITQRIQVARSGIADPNKPIGVFLLAGPSGVGKTETALALAEALYGGEQNLITINMSEFQEAHTVSTLKGAPPGYVGYGEGGVLTEAVRRRPYSVILLDEIEKAHKDVHEIFFQVFDKGRMEDGEGRLIDFKNTVILLTSNVAAEHISDLCIDHALMPTFDALTEAIDEDLHKAFPSAFLGRLTVVPYLPLQADRLTSIVNLHLEKIRARVQSQHGIEVQFSDELLHHVINQCQVGNYGARLFINFIEHNILPRIGKAWLEAMSEGKTIKTILMGLDDGCISHHVNFVVQHA